MAVNGYIQAAAGQLQSAAQALKGEIDRERADFMAYEQQATRDIHSLEDQIRTSTVEIGMAGDTRSKASVQMNVQKLKAALTAKQKDLEARRAALNNAIRGQEGTVNGLNNQARNLQNQASSLK